MFVYPMSFKNSIPNIFTSFNLLCGCLAIVSATNDNAMWTAYFVGIAAIFDFLDGMVARALKVQSPIGKDLDSLADMVSFGVVPGLIMFKLIGISLFTYGLKADVSGNTRAILSYLPYLSFLITIFAAIRLARFNVFSADALGFTGMPTPACAIFIASLPLIIENQDISNEFLMESVFLSPLFPIATTLLVSYLMVSKINMFSLKFKTLGWEGNKMRYVFLVLAIALIIPFKFLGVMFTMILYILLSLINNKIKLTP